MANIENIHRGEINPDDGDGKNMNFKMTKGFDYDNKFELTSRNISNFRDQIEEAAHTFCFGSTLFNIPMFHDDEGSIIETWNLVAEPNVVTKGLVVGFSSQVWVNDEGDHAIDSNGNPETVPNVLQ